MDNSNGLLRTDRSYSRQAPTMLGNWTDVMMVVDSDQLVTVAKHIKQARRVLMARRFRGRNARQPVVVNQRAIDNRVGYRRSKRGN